MKKTWWLEALKDFTFHRRTPRASGEVFQEPIPIAAQLIHKKLAKRTAEPAVAAPVPEPAPVAESEPDPDTQPALSVTDTPAVFYELPPSDPAEPVTVFGQDSPATPPPAATASKPRGKKSKSQADAD